MIRIIYSWKVVPENQDIFKETWKMTTNKIHEEVKGARGSFMIQSDKNTEEIKTVARWDCLEDWKRFWQEKRQKQMGKMHELGERTSVEIFQEVADFTK